MNYTLVCFVVGVVCAVFVGLSCISDASTDTYCFKGSGLLEYKCVSGSHGCSC
jgi:hypothetical protein